MKAPDFSVVLGGPLFQIMRRAKLSGSELELLRRRLIFFPLICWLPLLVLSAVQGRVISGVEVPFLQDYEIHIRFLAAVPLLISAEVAIYRRTRLLTAQFLERNLINSENLAQFEAAINSATRLRNSVAMEIFLISLVYIFGVLVIWRQFVALDMDTWYAQHNGQYWQHSLAGLWLGLVSIPIFQFLVLRWYYRIFIWGRFLFQVSRIPMRLVATHPDGAGGIGFLGGTVLAFSPLLMAHGAMLAGLIAGRIFHGGATLLDFKLEIAAMIALLLCLVYGPLLAFSSPLWTAKEAAKREYGVLAQTYVRGFEAKWLRGDAAPDESLLGSADIQSLADLATSYDLVRSMQTTLISKEGVIYLACVCFAPILPLALTMMPLEELLTRLFGIFF